MSQPVIGNFQIGSFADTNSPNGIPVRSDSTISFDNALRRLTITPTGTDYIIFTHGMRLFITTTKTIVIPNVEGIHYIYFDSDGELYSSQIESRDYFDTFALVCEVYWSVAGGYAVYVSDERHGIIMDSDTHYYIHNNPYGATIYLNGLGITNATVDGNGSSNTHAQFGVDNGIILDEDLEHIIVDGSPQDISPISNLPVLYKSGAAGEWRKKTADTYPFIYAGQEGSTGSLVSYNEWTGATWQLTEMATNDYMLLHIFATNDIYTPIMAVQGITEYTTLADATAGAQDEINNITGLPFEESVAIATLILQTSSSFTNTPAAIFVSDSNGNSYIDWRLSRPNVAGGNGNIVTHGDLGEYTLATLPTAAIYPNTYALVTDAAGGRTIVRSDGTNWKIVTVEGATVS